MPAYRSHCVRPDVQGQHQAGGREVAQGQGGVDGEGPEHRVAPPALALPEAQVPGEEQHQGGHESERDDDQVEAAAEVADPHRSAGNAEKADEAAQLLGGGGG